MNQAIQRFSDPRALPVAAKYKAPFQRLLGFAEKPFGRELAVRLFPELTVRYGPPAVYYNTHKKQIDRLDMCALTDFINTRSAHRVLYHELAHCQGYVTGTQLPTMSSEEVAAEMTSLIVQETLGEQIDWDSGLQYIGNWANCLFLRASPDVWPQIIQNATERADALMNRRLGLS